MKILGLAIVGTALMLGIAVLTASVLRLYNREIVCCVLLSIAALSMLAPVMVIDCKKEWITDLAIFCMAFFPIEVIMIAGML